MKTHIVLLDNRFSFDKPTKDRLGDQQWSWLDEALETHSDANVTLILAGVQMIRDNTLVEENFQWWSKSKLFSLISKHQKSNVLLLSGDVHYANRYQTNCEALTGYTVPEFTSSGMTHNIATFGGGVLTFLESVIDIFQDPNYSVEYSYHDFNYGHVSIDTETNTLNVSINDINGNSVMSSQFDLTTDLQFDPAKLSRNTEFCKVQQRDHSFLMKLIAFVRGITIK